jgi:hypothetical protein
MKPRRTDEGRKEKTADSTSVDSRQSAAQYDVIREVSKTSKFYVPEDFANGYGIHV